VGPAEVEVVVTGGVVVVGGVEVEEGGELVGDVPLPPLPTTVVMGPFST
jgi:hypothetical protein